MRGIFATGFAITLLGILLLQTGLPVMVKSERELAYDSGTPGASVSLPYIPQMWAGGDQEVNEQYKWIGNSMLAVRFTPDNSTLQILLGVRFYITGDLASFNVWVFDSNRIFLTYGRGPGSAPGSSVITRVYSWTVTPVSTGWVSLNVTDVTYPIFLPGDFYVALEFTSQNSKLGLDTIGAISARSWVVHNQTTDGWIAYSTYAKQNGLPDGNLMIRADVSPIYNMMNEATTTTGAAQVFPLTVVFPGGNGACCISRGGARSVAGGETPSHKVGVASSDGDFIFDFGSGVNELVQ